MDPTGKSRGDASAPDSPALTSGPAARSLQQRIQGHWATRSLGAGAISSGLDFSVLTTLVTVFHVAPVPAAVAGVVSGGTVAFLLNKYVAFRDHATPILPQALRYVGSMLVAVSVHASLMFVMTSRLHIHFLIAKVIDDLLVFTVGNLLVLRLYVFRHAPAVRE